MWKFWNFFPPESPSKGEELQDQFDLKQYCGKWYEIYRTKNIPFEKGSNVEAQYSLKDSDGSVCVTNREYNAKERKWKSIAGRATVPDPEKPAKLLVKFKSYIPAGDYRVLWTDYEQMALVYSEVSLLRGMFRWKYAWILARTPTLPEELIEMAFEQFEKEIQLDRQKFQETLHLPIE